MHGDVKDNEWFCHPSIELQCSVLDYNWTATLRHPKQIEKISLHMLCPPGALGAHSPALARRTSLDPIHRPDHSIISISLYLGDHWGGSVESVNIIQGRCQATSNDTRYNMKSHGPARDHSIISVSLYLGDHWGRISEESEYNTGPMSGCFQWSNISKVMDPGSFH